MYVPADEGVRIYSVVTPLMPAFIDTYATSSYVTEVKVRGNLMYIYMSGSSLVEIADITIPTAPVFVGSGINGTSSTQDMAIDGQFAYFSGNEPAISACWIWPPETPTPYGVVFPDPYAGGELHSKDGYLYKITLGNGMRIFDLY
jgi:hypothetical protein